MNELVFFFFLENKSHRVAFVTMQLLIFKLHNFQKLPEKKYNFANGNGFIQQKTNKEKEEAEKFGIISFFCS